ncbi:helix-turn-helix domain-containing protein [Streptomyces sp. NPDC058861]|uniref:helix-turn-helix domain-containing protein n=1 Tax=Streptomyces sp. NPDC058861 TaxID=3346653 RepID=UPI003681CCDE
MFHWPPASPQGGILKRSVSQAQIAQALGTRREAVSGWEAGRTEPRPPQRAVYARLLEKLGSRTGCSR